MSDLSYQSGCLVAQVSSLWHYQVKQLAQLIVTNGRHRIADRRGVCLARPQRPERRCRQPEVACGVRPRDWIDSDLSESIQFTASLEPR